MSNCCNDQSCPACQEAAKKFNAALQEQKEKASVEQKALQPRAPKPGEVIDATKPGTGIWRCQYCGQAYLVENNLKRFQCINGCPGRTNKVDNFKRPAAEVVKRIRGER